MNYYANARDRRDDSFQALLTDQARTSDELTELQEFDEHLRAAFPERHRLVLLDRPAPVRGYALIFPLSREEAGARIHVLDDTPAEAARALFSQTIVQARQLFPDALPLVLVDSAVTSDYTATAIREHGEPFGLRLSQVDEEGEEGEEYTSSPAVFSVHLNFADGTTPSKTFNVAEGTVLQAPENFLKDLPATDLVGESLFLGWYEDPGDGADWVLYDWNTPVTRPLVLSVVRQVEEPEEPEESEPLTPIEKPEAPSVPEDESEPLTPIEVPEDGLPPLEEIPEDAAEYACDFEGCGRTFASKQGLGSHSRTHQE